MGTIRLILALAVVFGHSTDVFFLRFMGGMTAVKAFYVISGFYMALILNEKYIGVNSSYKLFITNRFLRLYPVYFVVLVSTLIYSLIAYFLTDGADAGRLGAYLEHYDSLSWRSLPPLIFTNISIFFQDAVMFLGLDPSTGGFFFTKFFKRTEPQLHTFLLVPQAWTLGIELLFYLAAPFIARRRLRVVLFILGASLAVQGYLHFRGLRYDPWTYRFFPSELAFFMLGIVAYRIKKKTEATRLPQFVPHALFCSMILWSIFHSAFSFIADTVVYILFLAAALPFICQLSSRWKVDRYIGELSYPIYISHFLIRSILDSFAVERSGPLLATLSVIAAVALNALVARPMESIRQQRVTGNLVSGGAQR